MAISVALQVDRIAYICLHEHLLKKAGVTFSFQHHHAVKLLTKIANYTLPTHSRPNGDTLNTYAKSTPVNVGAVNKLTQKRISAVVFSNNLRPIVCVLDIILYLRDRGIFCVGK